MIVSVLTIVAMLVFVMIEKGGTLLKGLDIFIFYFTVIIGIVALYITFVKNKEIKEGQPVDDEMSLFVKYKAGYKAYIASMYMWLIIFLLRDKFPNAESMVGGGVLISAFIFFITKHTVKKELNE